MVVAGRQMEEFGAVWKKDAKIVRETDREDETRMRADARVTQSITPDVAAPAPASMLAPVPTDAAAPTSALLVASESDAASLFALSDAAALKLEVKMKNVLLPRGEAPIEALPLAEARKHLAAAVARYQDGDQARVLRARAPRSTT